MAEVWVEGGYETLWELNCLQYAGAKTVVNRKATNKIGVPEYF